MNKRLFLKNKKITNRYKSAWSINELLGIWLWNIAWLIFYRLTPKKIGNFIRVFILKIFGANIDWDVFLYPSSKVYVPWNLTIKSRSCLGPYSEVYNLGKVEIEENVTISQYAYICNGTHDLTKKDLPLLIGEIKIGKDVFVGAKAIIMPGVSISEFGVVGAGSVLTKDLNAYEIAAGNPAKVIKMREING